MHTTANSSLQHLVIANVVIVEAHTLQSLAQHSASCVTRVTSLTTGLNVVVLPNRSLIHKVHSVTDQNHDHDSHSIQLVKFNKVSTQHYIFLVAVQTLTHAGGKCSISMVSTLTANWIVGQRQT